jgi:biopolymer transport protein ExbB
MDFILNGELILWVLGFISLLATTIILERLMYFRKIKGDEDTLIARLKATLEKGHYDEALSICEANPSPVTNLMKVGIEHRDLPLDMIKNMVTDAANMEIPKMERYLSSLGTISSIAPLLGLLGTVLGNISSFNVMNQLADLSEHTVLAGGIAGALVTTAVGIVVSIPAIIFYNYLVAKVNHIIIRLENRVNELVLFLGKAQNKAVN